MRLRPEEYVAVLKYGIGLTDLAKRSFGSDASLPSGCFDAAQLRAKIEAAQIAKVEEWRGWIEFLIKRGQSSLHLTGNGRLVTPSARPEYALLS